MQYSNASVLFYRGSLIMYKLHIRRLLVSYALKTLVFEKNHRFTLLNVKFQTNDAQPFLCTLINEVSTRMYFVNTVHYCLQKMYLTVRRVSATILLSMYSSFSKLFIKYCTSKKHHLIFTKILVLKMLQGKEHQNLDIKKYNRFMLLATAGWEPELG